MNLLTSPFLQKRTAFLSGIDEIMQIVNTIFLCVHICPLLNLIIPPFDHFIHSIPFFLINPGDWIPRDQHFRFLFALLSSSGTSHSLFWIIFFKKKFLQFFLWIFWWISELGMLKFYIFLLDAPIIGLGETHGWSWSCRIRYFLVRTWVFLKCNYAYC